ncbi:MAG TPA: hypothetical protein VJ783_00660 [Pirellulales bacterium]|nr:hypothetical protein [Pirellulales bacterium]
MSWLFEDPTMLIASGVLIEALLAVALVKSGRAALLLVMAGVLVLVLGGVFVERMVVTEREEIEATLDGVSQELEANNIEGVLSWIDPASGGMREDVRARVSQARISEVRVFDLNVSINHYVTPPTAQAYFTGRIRGRYRGEGSSGEGMLLRRLTVDFRQAGDRWLITGYQDRRMITGHDQ